MRSPLAAYFFIINRQKKNEKDTAAQSESTRDLNASQTGTARANGERTTLKGCVLIGLEQLVGESGLRSENGLKCPNCRGNHRVSMVVPGKKNNLGSFRVSMDYTP